MTFRATRFLLSIALLLCLLAAAPAGAQPAGGAAPGALTPTDWNAALAPITRQLRDPRMDDEGFAALRADLDRLRVQATTERDQFRQAATSAQSQLDALGPAPAAGQPREAAAVTESRRQLAVRLQSVQDSTKQAELALTRIVALQDEVADEARRQFTRQLLYRGVSPFNPDFWHSGFDDIGAISTQVMAVPAQWWAADEGRRPGHSTLLQIVIVVALASVLLIPTQRWLRRNYGIHPENEDPSPVRRTIAAFTVLIGHTAMPLVVLWAAYGVLAGNSWLTGLVGSMVLMLMQAVSTALLAYGLAHATLAPYQPVWALIPLPERERKTLLRRTGAFAVGMILLAVLVAPSRVPDFGFAGRNMVIAAVALFLFVANLAFSDPRLWRSLPDEWRPLRLLAGLIFGLNLIALVALLLGYYGAAAFLSYGLLGSALSLGAYALVRIAVRDGLANLAESPDSRFRVWRQSLGLSGPMSTTSQLLLGLLADIILFLLLLAGLAVSWGVSRATLISYTLELFYGVTIGPVTISLGNILTAVVVLVIGIGITRLLSGGLNSRLETQAGIDPGVRNSMVTGLTYAGYLLAILAGVGVVGLDLSNLAIIAGALSVGIGFGLQNIVNNFVSGLILLIERPVKVGDWVVVGTREGYVRRINVRSTEIETFPRASVIIPNSELISQSVMNWTHRNRLGRIDIQISLSYNADLEKAREVLLKCLTEHPDILSMPAPVVIFREFEAGTLLFALRGHISDVEKRHIIESDLRFAIHKALKESGVGLPYGGPNTLHLADIERLEKALGGLRAAQDRPKSDQANLD
ncbi:MAG: mechanosensitive ion channel family protein [Alphaproteobacteria bacterium]|nr:mechanosensitive ion channel family protein [Alphaproteobacteria bacterium]